MGVGCTHRTNKNRKRRQREIVFIGKGHVFYDLTDMTKYSIKTINEYKLFLFFSTDSERFEMLNIGYDNILDFPA